MFTKRTVLAVLFVGVIACATGLKLTSAAESKSENQIVMTVEEMCGGCVKKITKRFDDVKNVAKVSCSTEEKTVTVFPKDDAKLSPKAVWEIMEEIGKTPKKMVVQSGTFTSKPKS